MKLTKDEFRYLYEQHSPRVRGLLLRLCRQGPVEDLLQETFVKVWRGLDSFREESEIHTWIYRVAWNTAQDHLRQQGRRPESVLLDAPETEGVAAFSQMKDSTPLLDLRRALDTLDEQDRVLCFLFYSQELELSEIAAMLDLREGTLKSRLFRLREKLRSVLSRKAENHER